MEDTYGDGLSMGRFGQDPVSAGSCAKSDKSVVKPNMNLPVLIYCRRDCGEIALEE
jgi:hypothetical protein